MFHSTMDVVIRLSHQSSHASMSGTAGPSSQRATCRFVPSGPPVVMMSIALAPPIALWLPQQVRCWAGEHERGTLAPEPETCLNQAT